MKPFFVLLFHFFCPQVPGVMSSTLAGEGRAHTGWRTRSSTLELQSGAGWRAQSSLRWSRLENAELYAGAGWRMQSSTLEQAGECRALRWSKLEDAELYASRGGEKKVKNGVDPGRGGRGGGEAQKTGLNHG